MEMDILLENSEQELIVPTIGDKFSVVLDKKVRVVLFYRRRYALHSRRNKTRYNREPTRHP